MSTGPGAQVESTPRPSGPETGNEDVRSPDIGLLYHPPDGTEDYRPGVIVEAGYSHPLHDLVAKRKSFNPILIVASTPSLKVQHGEASSDIAVVWYDLF